jgi:hypothetical protein
VDTEVLAALPALLEALGEQSSELRLELGGRVVMVTVKPAGDRRAGPLSIHAGAAQHLAALAERGITVRQVRIVTEPR